MADGAARFRQDSSGPALLRITLCGLPMPGTQLSCSAACLSRHVPLSSDLQRRGPTTPLGSSAFARRYLRNHCCFLFLRVLRCFSSPGWPLSRWRAFRAPGSPIRKSADLRAFAPPRGLSQLVTSFFASESLGIPRAPLIDFLVSSFNCKSILSDGSKAVRLTFDSS